MSVIRINDWGDVIYRIHNLEMFKPKTRSLRESAIVTVEQLELLQNHTHLCYYKWDAQSINGLGDLIRQCIEDYQKLDLTETPSICIYRANKFLKKYINDELIGEPYDLC